jgi:hypothetical protein
MPSQESKAVKDLYRSAAGRIGETEARTGKRRARGDSGLTAAADVPLHGSA